MFTTEMTHDGQTTIPEDVRELLNLRPGDRLEFVISEDGKVYLQSAKIDVRELSGMLYKPGRDSVSVEEMNEAIAQCAGESD
ncbi:MAG: type II toxin-antitoxin system PrlF family antitoxin [Myxacorys chilensis ATA2-1-KO14]|jgi:AbrB family looped-hinge helix DNA binding protein|nr:type II toxin-antitoxin system PrlF family antitoxin [Myxacorys chilensis ATA2-1-KO14]